MQCIIHPTAAEPQQLATTWQGQQVEPPFKFLLSVQGGNLVFQASRAAAAHLHPAAQPGEFREELWRYDVVEFFIATPDAKRYLEFNLCANGAWWAAAFTNPREPLPGFDARELSPATTGSCTPAGWACEARIPLLSLEHRGWQPAHCRMAVCAVLCREGHYTYLTTCEAREGKPDFHHPWDWEPARLVP